MQDTAAVVVIGGNPGGCAAAISAARSGHSVVLLEPTQTLGGINANGVFAFDSATPEALSGIAEEVSARIKAHYAQIGLDDPLFHRRADQVWESHVNARVWRDLVEATPGIKVRFGAVAVDAKVEADDDGGRRVTKVEWQSACDVMGNLAHDAETHTVVGQIFIDASYEGDVTAWSGAPFRIGREARSALEPHAGIIFTTNMDAASDGTLPQSVLPGSSGEADERIMASACRLHCRIYDDTSIDAPHRIGSPPPGYDPANYEWKPVDVAPDGSPVHFNLLYVLVNNKFLVNRMVKGNNLAGPARDYILAHPRDRKPLRQRFIDHALGYLYFIQTEAGCPQIGLANDEFVDNGNIPYQIYVREGRRVVGDDLLTEADITPFITGDGFRPPFKPDSIAIHDWLYESHGCTDEIPPGKPNPEGFIYNRVARAPYQIPYGCLLPQKVDNLLVAGPISATHIAWSAARCESARIQVGIAAGIAAGMALARNCKPRDVNVQEVQQEILRRGGKLTYFSDVPSEHPDLYAIQWAALRSLVPSDPHWRFFPDRHVSWAEMAEAIVCLLRLPISVTGSHFEHAHRYHPAFRFFESLYDLGTRNGVDVFDSRTLSDEDPLVAMLRADRNARKIPILVDGLVPFDAAVTFLRKVCAALAHETGRMLAVEVSGSAGPLTRAAMCRLLCSIDATWSARSSSRHREHRHAMSA